MQIVNNVPSIRQISALWKVLLLARVVVGEAEFSNLKTALNLAVVSEKAGLSHLISLLKVEYVIGPHPSRGHETCLLLDVVMYEPDWLPTVPVRLNLGEPARRAMEYCQDCGGELTVTLDPVADQGGSGGVTTRSGRRPGGSGE